jgi:protein O-mannosyl-transferase
MTVLNRKSLHVCLIVVVGLILYARTLQVPFILDDFESIAHNPLITSFAYFSDLGSGKIFFGHAGFVSRWFGYLSFALNYRFHGLDLAGYHAVNIAIHLLGALSVYWIVRLTFRTPYFLQGRAAGRIGEQAGFTALVAALLFVAHPLQTQAVTYLIQRLASLAALLYLISLACYIQGRLAGRGTGKLRLSAAAWFAASLFSAFLALKTKQNSCTLPLTVLLYELLFFTGTHRKKLMGALLALGALAGSAGALLVFRSGRSWEELLGQLDLATRLQTDTSRWDYLATQLRVIVTYLRLVVLPVGQRLEYDYPVDHSFLSGPVLFSGALLSCLVAVACICLQRSSAWKGDDGDASPLLRVIAFGIFWFFIALSIESSIIPIVDVIFEHRMYLPLAGLFMALAASLALASGECGALAGWPKLPVVAGAAGVLLLLSGLTIARNETWRSEVGLWQDNTQKTPNKGRVYLNLGAAQERAGNLAGAEEAYLAANTLTVDQPFSRLDLGRLYLQSNRLDEAQRQFQEALGIDPTMGDAYNNIGKILEMKNQNDEALKEYLKAVRYRPYLATPYLNIGRLYARQKRYPEAIKEYEKAIVRDPAYSEAFIGRGEILLATGRRSEAIADFRRALQISPTSAEAAQQLKLAGSAP